jgi:copper binding protein CusF
MGWGAPRLIGVAVPLLLASALYAGAPELTVHGEGRVVAVDRSRGWITVEHGTIGKLFVAGRTEFPVEATDRLARVRVDDRVGFELTTSADGHGVLSISDIRPLGRDLHETPGARVTPREAGLAALVSLLAAIAGFLGLRARRVRRLLEARDAMVADLREQVRLQRETKPAGETEAAALVPVLRGCQSDLRCVSERIQVALDAPRDAPEVPGDTARPMVIVRRGETAIFRDLDERLGKPGWARVIWDRRRQERRSMARPTGTERRRRGRRGPLPVTWHLGYAIAQSKARRLDAVA